MTMTIQDLWAAIDRAGCMSVTTLDGQGTMHSRIVHLCGADDEGLYFMTMNVKPFYRQLVARGKVAICGMYPSARHSEENDVGQPRWAPGYTVRLTGDVREVGLTEVRAKAGAGVEGMQFMLDDGERYPAMRFFCVHRAKGEIFDFDFETERRDHKLLRTRFAFGGMTVGEPGARIDPDECIACGECFEACTFKAIVPGEDDEAYSVHGARCDECGSCSQVCPQGAVQLSDEM